MKRSGWATAGAGCLLLELVLAGAALPILAADAPAHAYIGVEKCKLCHNAPAKGAQYAQWTQSAHAKAYQTLGSEEAKKVGAARGIADPQKAPQCLRCHVTGHGAPADKLTDKYKAEDGVGCESCHGPGGDYWKMEVMKDHAKSVAAGLVVPTEATCRSCHNPDNPTHKGFEFTSFSAKVAHPNPQKAAAK